MFHVSPQRRPELTPARPPSPTLQDPRAGSSCRQAPAAPYVNAPSPSPAVSRSRQPPPPESPSPEAPCRCSPHGSIPPIPSSRAAGQGALLFP
jgi:hypothetical protein